MALGRAGKGPGATDSPVTVTVDAALQQRPAFWRGNVAAVHRELVQAAADGGPPAPSFPTLHRAINRALSPGELAGLRKGEWS